MNNRLRRNAECVPFFLVGENVVLEEGGSTTSNV